MNGLPLEHRDEHEDVDHMQHVILGEKSIRAQVGRGNIVKRHFQLARPLHEHLFLCGLKRNKINGTMPLCP